MLTSIGLGPEQFDNILFGNAVRALGLWQATGSPPRCSTGSGEFR